MEGKIWALSLLGTLDLLKIKIFPFLRLCDFTNQMAEERLGRRGQGLKSDWSSGSPKKMTKVQVLGHDPRPNQIRICRDGA